MSLKRRTNGEEGTFVIDPSREIDDLLHPVRGWLVDARASTRRPGVAGGDDLRLVLAPAGHCPPIGRPTRSRDPARPLLELIALVIILFGALLFCSTMIPEASRATGSAQALRALILAPLGNAAQPAVDGGGEGRLPLAATLDPAETIAKALLRAGVGPAEAAAVGALVDNTVPAGSVGPGATLELVLERGKFPGAPRTLVSLRTRAGIDREVVVDRRDGRFRAATLRRGVDDTPLRIQAAVGDNFTRSALEAGVPSSVVQQYLQVIDANSRFATDLRPDDIFDIVVGYKRAAGGERQTGDLLLARLERDGRTLVELMNNGRGTFVEASGSTEAPWRQGAGPWPVSGRVTSGFGMRLHPLLGYERMHSGMDLAAPWGTPIRAFRSGVVLFAGWSGGHGEYVTIRHDGGLASGYGHMSRIAVQPGTPISAGEIIGYVGATGLATGPHLHFELFRDGRAINPLDVVQAQAPVRAPSDWAAFRARLASLKKLVPGAALRQL